jgi:dTDP-4-amino-4,6-dideoxygalactose transaminase
MIPYHRPYKTNEANSYAMDALDTGRLCGGHKYSKLCIEWLSNYFQNADVLLTPSCTDALEMAMILLDLKEGDEVIVPSYTFPSTANCIILAGGTPIFIDCAPDTMQMTPALFEQAITAQTRAVIPVHYAGQSCDMDTIMSIADRHNIKVVADAAQTMFATYKNKPSATYGHMATISFHETKNITSGEGGCLVINDSSFIERAKIIHEKGTNRSAFLRGEVDKYSWVDKGSSFVMSDLSAALLLSQLQLGEEITQKRTALWNFYEQELLPLHQENVLKIARPSAECGVNGHIFYIILDELDTAIALQRKLKANNIQAVTHYVPLHASKAGKSYGKIHGDLQTTATLSPKLLRLPLYADMSKKDAMQVVNIIKAYFKGTK